ncbi:MAG: DUF308 domain-containing protein [Coprococcus sp.]
MFNLVMGIIMVGVGCICLVWAFFSKTMAVQIFFGCAMMIFGIVEIIRSKSIRNRKKAARNREFDAYMMMAQQMGVVVNPITGEIVSKENSSEKEDENKKEIEESGQEKTL